MTSRWHIHTISLHLVLVAALCWHSSGVLGQQHAVPYCESLSGAAGQLAVDSSRTVQDSVYFDRAAFPVFDTASVAITNMIVLYMDELSTVIPPDSFNVSVDVRLYFLNRDSVYDSIASKTLTIEYNKSRAYANKAVFYFSGAHRVQMKVLSITSPYSTIPAILPLLKLENRMTVSRTFTMDCEENAIQTISIDDDSVSTSGELKVSWAANPQSQEYDLEWTYVDQAALDAGWYDTGGNLDPEKLFRNNATRVTLLAPRYKIPLLYEGEGRLFIRVRGAQTATDGERITANWSSDFVSEGGLGQYSFTGHETTLNWQASTSFAEEGKRKSVVQYFDGTLRGRQTVTKDNSLDSTLTAETFYDKQGRAVVQVLPSPTLSSIIKYTPLFNRAPGGVEYSRALYDTLQNAADYCNGGAPAMDSAYGAAKYYSRNNPNRYNGFNQYIPRAEGYPFTEVKYTQDNSGRVAAQGGVGPQFQLSSGHETKYYYGTPSQQELDALFGTEAGYAAHYQKNMVRDANGQYSISYVDMHGRTVATALAGDTTGSSLRRLDSYSYDTQTDSLLTAQNNMVKGNTIESVQSLLVPVAGTHTFTYTLDAESLSLEDKDEVEICYDCLYDLTITITDDCNNQHLPGGNPYIYRDSNMRVAPPVYDTTCTPAGDFSVSFDLALEEGSYMITKKLTLREDARDWYRDSLYAPHNTVRTKEDIIAQQLSAIRAQRDSAGCVQEGEPYYEYQQYRDQMMLDLTPPFGQYARYQQHDGGPEKDTLPLYSIFNIQSNPRPATKKNYLYQTVTYSDGTDPKNMEPDAFMSNFEPQWAEDMLSLHPEYGLLQGYEKFAPSYHWDAGFEATDTYAAALAKGYLNPTNSGSSPASLFGSGSDSLFYNNIHPTAKTWIEGQMQNYKSPGDGHSYNLWTMASIAGHCDLRDQSCVDGFRNEPSALFGSAMCQGELDMAWRFFRNEYLRLKHKWIDDTLHPAINPAILLGGSPVFPQQSIAFGSDLLGDDPEKAQQAADDSLAAQGDRNCREYAKRWWEQLAPCNYTTEDSLIIVPRLVEVCKQGTDSTHPFGASSVAPGSSYAYTSFDDVITKYNSSRGLPNSPACNAYLIDAPGPYNKPFVVISQPTYNRPDSCTCDKINALYTKYQGTAGYSDFSDYIQQTLHTTISQADLDSLRDLCNGTGCRFKVNPITIPPALQCGTDYDICVDCNQVNAVYNNFKAAFPGSIPSYADTSELQQQTNQLFQHYMNDKLGFSKASYEYLAFMDSCGMSFAYDSLQALTQNFNKDINPLRVSAICQSNTLNPPVYLTDITESVTDGALHWPKPIQDTATGYFEYFQHRVAGTVFCEENGYAIEFRFKFLKDDIYPSVEFFYFTDVNGGFVLYKRKNNPENNGVFLARILGADSVTGNLAILYNSSVLIDTDPDMIFKKWTTVKYEVTPLYIRIYANNVLLKEIPRMATLIFNTSGFTYSFMHFQGIVDWTKIYDHGGNLVFFDDYLTNKTRQTIDASFACTPPATSCETAFTNYFNTQKGTSYTFSQIDSLYFAVGGKHLDVCGTGIYGGTDSLSGIIDSFYVNARPGRVDHSITPQAASPLHDLSQIVRNGLAVLPDSIRNLPGSDYNSYQLNFNKFCTSSGYSVASRFRFLNDSLSGDVFYLDYGNMIPLFYKDTNGKLYLEKVTLKGASVDTINLSVLVDSNMHALLDYMTVKGIVKPSKYELYYNNRLVFEHSRNLGDTIGNKESFVWGLRGRHGAIDWVRIGDANDSTKYFEDFDDISRPATVDTSFICTSYTPCQQAFVSYYNAREGTSYTYEELDSVYTAGGLVLDACPIDTTAIRCDQLEKYVDTYKQQYIAPSSGYVDLDMRTFAGNKTPDEGPKGVFDVNGKLLGNTVDSTPTAVKQSYVQIWNRSADNRAVGTLSLLENGRFRLRLNAGRQAPPQGVIGQRYYQFDANTNDTIAFDTGIGTYIDFGDSSSVLTSTQYSDPKSQVFIEDTVGWYYSGRNVLGDDFIELKRAVVRHFYTHSDSVLRHPVTVYHTDFKGVMTFSDHSQYPIEPIPAFSHLKGYAPQHLLEFVMNGIRDSTFNTTEKLKNFDQINSIQNIEFDSYGTGPFFRNKFGSFARNHDLRRLRLIPLYHDSSEAQIDTLAGNLFSENFPNFSANFPEMRFLYWAAWGPRSSDIQNFDFQLPKLKIFYLYGQDTDPPGTIDSIYNQLARVNQLDSGIIYYGYATENPSVPTSASADAKNYLLGKGWYLRDGVSNLIGPGPIYDIVSKDPLLMFSSFTDYINSKLGTDLNKQQIDSLYLSKCGHLPDCCSAPDTSLPATLMLCGKNEPPPAYTLEQIYEPPCSDSTVLANNSGVEIYSVYKDSLDNSFAQRYNEKCLAAAAIEAFTVSHPVSEYHYTLYYYDQAGNLVKTIPPAGVSPNRDPAWLADVRAKRRAGERSVPGHTLPTIYRYNSLNQVVSRLTPDAGLSASWYDRLGRPAVSQDAAQQPGHKYSYTLYDPLGRPVETGQKYQTTAMTGAISRNPGDLESWIYYNDGSNHYPAEMVTQTVYDVPGAEGDACPAALRFTQKPYTLRNRVSYTRYYEKPSYYYDAGAGRYYVSPATFTTGVDYSYDIHGNVDTMRNLYGTATYAFMSYHGYNACKTIAYKYDLISGKVNEVHYNPGENDEFYYRYEYDAENRLVKAFTTDNKVFIGVQGMEERDAMYTYYQHGPLARLQLAQTNIQGIDYAYTLQGWLKGFNSTRVSGPAYDIGEDSQGPRSFVPQDEVGLTLHYFYGDYSPINYDKHPFAEPQPYFPAGAYHPLYNGNISSMGHSIPARFYTQLYNYRYDQLNRLIEMDMYRGITSTNTWGNLAASDLYKERYSYDANGNIIHVLRNGNLTANPLMDSLTYFYKPGANQLDYVRDKNNGSTAHSSNYGAAVDIKDQSAANYSYDGAGNLQYDRFSGVDSITWNVYGKMQRLYKQAIGSLSSATLLHNYYDPSGERVGKATIYGNNTSPSNIYTWYVRDAQGNVMAVYQTSGSNIASTPLLLLERYMYGSSRLGSIYENRDMSTDRLTTDNSNANLGTAYLTTFTRGKKFFEVSNHLGTIMTILNDRRTPQTGGGVVTGYSAVMQFAADYTPFGMEMLGRAYSGSSSPTYRYKFNGKERIYEINGRYHQYDYGARIYDAMFDRFWTPDPLAGKYPWYSPYQFAGNKPIWATDLDGMEENTTSTYVYRPPVLALKPTFKGTISITNDIAQKAHKTFEGNYGQLANADQSHFFPNIVQSLTGSNIGTSESRLDITMTGTRSEVSKTWMGSDVNYFIQFAYSFTNNNVTEIGTFEMQNGQIQASARAWDPLISLLATKVVSSILTRIGGNEIGIRNVKSFISSAKAESKNGLTVIGRALQKHAGREGSSFADIEFSGKTANQQGLNIMNEILNSKDILIQKAENGTTNVFDNITGRGLNVSREGLFNGFRDLKEVKK